MKCRFGRLLGGDHHHCDRLRKVRQLFHQFHPAHAGHLDIGDHDGRSKAGDLFQSFHAIGRSVGAIAPSRDQFGQPGSFVLFVFNDQHAFLRHSFPAEAQPALFREARRPATRSRCGNINLR